MKVHPIFYVSFLGAHWKSTISRRIQSSLPCIEIDNHVEYEMEISLIFGKKDSSWNILFISASTISINIYKN